MQKHASDDLAACYELVAAAGDRKIVAVRVFVAAHEWIVECVGVVDIQFKAFAAFAPAMRRMVESRLARRRTSTGEAVRQQDGDA